jgi:acyl carrier protein
MPTGVVSLRTHRDSSGPGQAGRVSVAGAAVPALTYLKGVSMSTGVPTTDPEELRRFVADVLDLDVDSLTDDAHFVAELGMDSLKALEVTVALEKKFKIKITEDEVRDITNFGEVREMVASKLS